MSDPAFAAIIIVFLVLWVVNTLKDKDWRKGL